MWTRKQKAEAAQLRRRHAKRQTHHPPPAPYLPAAGRHGHGRDSCSTGSRRCVALRRATRVHEPALFAWHDRFIACVEKGGGWMDGWDSGFGVLLG
jgi:hypothetical protein